MSNQHQRVLDWYHFYQGTGASGVAIPDPVDDSPDPPGYYRGDTPPRHSADDYRAIAERLKQLGYRGWITG